MSVARQHLVLTALAASVACATLFAPSEAAAQGWLSDRETASGPGFRLGDFELHPGIGAEAGYDSNVFKEDENPVGSGVLRITPYLYLSTLTAERLGDGEGPEELPFIQFKLGVDASLYVFFADEAPDPNANIGANLDLTIGRRKPFALRVTNDYNRNIRPFTDQGAVDNNYARNTNDAGVSLDLSTAGDVFRGSVGYNLLVDIYEGESFRPNNSLGHRASLNLSWKFLPQTALLSETTFDATNYTADEAGRVALLSDNFRLRTRVGINGALTNRLSLLVMAGYTAGFFDDDRLDEFDDFIAQLELGYTIRPGSKLSIGYDRDYFVALVGGWTRRDIGYVQLQSIIGGVFLIRAKASVGAWAFGRLIDTNGDPLGLDDETERNDLRTRAALYAEYRVLEWLAILADFSFTGTFTDFEFQREFGTGVIPDPAAFNQFEVFGGLRAFY